MTFASDGERVTDGVIATPGAPWNCGAASVIQPGGGLEWDLGHVVQVRSAFVQADNDDFYALLGSTDRRNWTTIWEAQPAMTPGLSNRHGEGLNAEARYLRIEPRGGDGSYAISELSIRGPDEAGPWPPKLEERRDEHSEVRGQRQRERMTALAALLAALAFGGGRLWQQRTAGDGDRRPLLWASYALSIFVVTTALVYSAKHRFNVVDDAYISLQYAKNWAQGHGLVFNPGERVEGFTNFLWTLLVVPLWPLSGHDPLLMTRLAGMTALAFAVIALWLTAASGRRIFGRSAIPAILALMLVAFDDSFVGFPVIFALENQLLMALMLAGLVIYLYRVSGYQWWLGLTFALVGMTRPDGLLWGATFLIVQAGNLLWQRRGKGTEVAATESAAAADAPLDLRSIIQIGAVFAGVFAAYFACRYAYYGELLPNTFHLKVGSTFGGLRRGFDYVHSFVEHRGFVPLAALLAVVVSSSPWVRWLFLHAVLHAAYIVYVGGDFYLGHRFLLVLVPNLALLAAVVFAAVLERVDRAGEHAPRRTLWLRRGALAAAVAVCALVRYRTLAGGPFMADVNGSVTSVDNNVQYMRWLADVARKNSSMVVGDIGATGLFADVRVIDFFGVVDRDVARKEVADFGAGKAGHEKVFTRAEGLARKPTYIKWGYVGDFERPPGYYIFNDFPPHLHVEGLWVLDDLAAGRVLNGAGFSFAPAQSRSFTRSGSAFEQFPMFARAPQQGYVNGQFGAFVNTYTAKLGDDATGALVSAPFLLEGDTMRLLVGGGRDPERLRVSLVLDGRRVFSETGTNWETLGRREWNIAPLRGKMATLEIVDRATGAWGHLLVDEVEQWVGTPNETGRL